MVRHEGWTGTSTPSNLPDVLATMSCHQPVRLQHDLQANAGLVKRLSHTESLKGHSSSVNALDWSSNGEVLLSGSDDCRVKLWCTETNRAVHSFDSVCKIQSPHANTYIASSVHTMLDPRALDMHQWALT